ncbi:uncharacterized protein LOC130813882 isoform X3 [Amaranthus tricolor]|uniref:uncharacterized protein LOC130813882 isoform X3 n=1 Tax=Amaranthus tricolor TaxID=29722 RepID=UPI00258AEDE5|nr:uncharacterized protein LOC130813882 isoform X3 [Amaranthus tricolor]
MLYQFFVSNLVEGISGPRLTILSKGCSSTLTLPSLCSQSIKFFSTIYRGVAMPLEAVIYKHYLIGLSLSNVSSAGATGIFLSVKYEINCIRKCSSLPVSFDKLKCNISSKMISHLREK